MTKLLSQLTDNGYKITPQRRIILDIINESRRPLTVEEISDQIKILQPSISIATIYRNLNLMVNIKLLSRLDLPSNSVRYQINQGDNHHLLCTECGKATKLGICPIEGEIARLVEEKGFKIDDHYFEITGICEGCQLSKKSEEKTCR
ncbi:MAG TPA: Fur family transcriptional regulator [Syntrophomonadaceae bacterium]|nr:Fur family transcriptional regulator [Syntrophomonadaceae bacterium]